MNPIALRTRFLVAVAVIAFASLAAAEPPSRAARLSFISGSVSFSPAGQDDWVRAVVNRPLTSGDRLWVDAGSRAELQVGGAAIRLGASTSVMLLNLDDRIAQVQLEQGTLKVRVRRMGANQAFEVNTPNLAFSMRRAGEYRIDADPADDATAVSVQSGRAEAYGERGSYAVNAGQGYRFYGTGLTDYDRLATRRDDDFDRWARDRDRRIEGSKSARYVSPDVVGYEELDEYGAWRTDPTYGNVWAPSRVAAGWTPYRDGHWSWVDPWGWTWVDDAPWGYAVSHYGRWANVRGAWVWVPGPPREQAVYAPALVGFVDGRNLQLAAAVGTAIAAAIGWFPLAPREVYRPSYTVSRGYFDRINRSNTAVAPAAITDIYNTTIVNRTTNITNVSYANQRVAGAVVAVPAQVFVQSQPVAKAAVPVSKDVAARAPVAAVAAVAPVQQSVHGGAATADRRPSGRQRPVVAHTAPPPAPAAFAAQQPQLAATPGVPIEQGKRGQLKPAASPSPAVVTAVQAPAPTAAPPATPPGGRSREGHRGDTARTDAARPDPAKIDAAKADAAKADAAKADAAKADAAKADAVKADAAKADAAKVEAAKVEAAKAAAAKGESSRVEAAKAEAAKVEAAKAEAAKGEAAKAAAAKDEAAKVDAAKAAVAKGDGSRGDGKRGGAGKGDPSRTDAAKAEAAAAEAARAAAAKAEAARADAAKADAAKAESARADAAKADAAKAASAKADAAKAESSRVEAAKAESARADAAKAKAEAARVDAAKADASKADAAKAENARAEAAKAEAGKAAAAKADAAKAEASRAEAAKAEVARAEAAKGAAAKADAAKADAAKAEGAKADAAKAAAKVEATKVEAAKVEAARVEVARADAAKLEAAKAEAAKGAKGREGREGRRDNARPEDEKKKAEEDERKR